MEVAVIYAAGHVTKALIVAYGPMVVAAVICEAAGIFAVFFLAACRTGGGPDVPKPWDDVLLFSIFIPAILAGVGAAALVGPSSDLANLIRAVIGVLAAAGGACWIAKTLLIWANGGTSTTGGAIGLLFLAGTALLAISVALWAWGATAGRAVAVRILAVGCALVGLFIAVNLPILVGYALIPGSWLAEEIGVIVVAGLAIVALPLSIRSRIRRPG